MAATISLTVTEGRLKGKEHTFGSRVRCKIGRGAECEIRLPSDPDYLDVSRRHCLLDIDPPDVRVCDLGSLNGTYVNGVKIGQRDRDRRAAEAVPANTEVLLHDGDEVRVGGTVFRVGIVYPVACTACGGEVQPETRPAAEAAPLCDWCRLDVGPAHLGREAACAGSGSVH